MSNVNPTRFLHEVRQEVVKVTWPTRKETLLTTGMVFLLVVVASLFFFMVDTTLAFAVKALFGVGGK